MEHKEREIEALINTIDVIERRARLKDEAASNITEANARETERLQKEKEEHQRQKETDGERMKKMEEEINEKTQRELSRRGAEQEKKFMARMEALELEMEQREKERTEELTKLETTNKKCLDTINNLEAQIYRQREQLKANDKAYEDLNNSMEMVKLKVKNLPKS